jgi:hypothetical protein
MLVSKEPSRDNRDWVLYRLGQHPNHRPPSPLLEAQMAYADSPVLVIRTWSFKFASTQLANAWSPTRGIPYVLTAIVRVGMFTLKYTASSSAIAPPSE